MQAEHYPEKSFPNFKLSRKRLPMISVALMMTLLALQVSQIDRELQENGEVDIRKELCTLRKKKRNESEENIQTLSKQKQNDSHPIAHLPLACRRFLQSKSRRRPCSFLR